MRAAITALQVLLCTTGAWSFGVITTQAADPTVRELRGEWQRAGASFACQVATQQQLPSEAIKPDVLMKACLHMGPLVIGGQARTLNSIAAASHHTLPQ